MFMFRSLAAPLKAASAVRRTMSTAGTEFWGVFPPIATAFNEDESLALDKMEANFQHWNKCGFAGYVLHGSNGEAGYLRREERVEMVKAVKQWIPAGKKLIVGVGLESTRDTIALATEAGNLGADAVLVLSPNFYKRQMTEKVFKRHYTAVADASPAPVIIYNVPQNTGIDLSGNLIVELAQHPNIVGLKDSIGDLVKLTSVVHKTKGQGFSVLAGSASFVYTAYSVGCHGVVPGLGNCLGAEVCRMDALYREGKFAESLELQRRLVEPNKAVTLQFGVPGLKKAMSWFGLYGGPSRSPLLPLDSSEEATLRKIFSDNGFLN